MRIHISAVVIVLTIILSGNSAAGETGAGRHSGEVVFSIHDTNQDGVLDKYEYERFLYLRSRRMETTDSPQRHRSSQLEFEEIDRDDDGYITEDELIVILNKRLHKQRRIRARESQW